MLQHVQIYFGEYYAIICYKKQTKKNPTGIDVHTNKNEIQVIIN